MSTIIPACWRKSVMTDMLCRATSSFSWWWHILNLFLKLSKCQNSLLFTRHRLYFLQAAHIQILFKSCKSHWSILLISCCRLCKQIHPLVVIVTRERAAHCPVKLLACLSRNSLCFQGIIVIKYIIIYHHIHTALCLLVLTSVFVRPSQNCFAPSKTEILVPCLTYYL